MLSESVFVHPDFPTPIFVPRNLVVIDEKHVNVPIPVQVRCLDGAQVHHVVFDNGPLRELGMGSPRDKQAQEQKRGEKQGRAFGPHCCRL